VINRNLTLGGSESFDTAGRLLQWILQLILATVVPCLTWGFLFETAPTSKAHSDWMSTQMVAMLEIAVLGGLSGLTVRRLFPSAKKIGRRIWILPCLVLVAIIVWDLFAFHFNWRVVSNDFFFGPELNIGESALLRDFLTYPAVSAITYSLVLGYGCKKVTPLSK
jgi:hypothetical protein